MAGKAFGLGLDFGTNSVRALIADVRTGEEIASAVATYPSGADGILLDPKNDLLARQHPGDWLIAMAKATRAAVKAARRCQGFAPENVVGIGVDTTGSTPLPLDRQGTPLALNPRFSKNLNAMAWLWKDHTSFAEARAITELAGQIRPQYLRKCGGVYSSEWFFSKIFHCRRVDKKVFAAASTWAECSDYIPAVLTGSTAPERMARNVCAAGHKAMYNASWGGLPDREFLAALDPGLGALRDRLYEKARTADQKAGGLTPEWAARFGLPAGVPVAVGAMDAHMGAVGAGIKPGTLVKIIGTSTCDMMVSPLEQKLADIPGVCGIVPGSVIPGMYGIEAGQSAVGDIFHWFVTSLTPPAFMKGDAHANLTRAAAKLAPGTSGLIALDWNNGNRTILVDPLLTGLLVGQTLHTTAPEIYRALIEATAFGALTIVRRIEEFGVKVKEVVNCGGIAEKNPLLMQIYADILNRPMKLSRSSQTCALGAAMFGAVAGGAYPNVEAAQRKMTGVKPTVYRPRPAAVKVYAELYRLYLELHDAFGLPSSTAKLGRLMKDLIAIRNRARA